MFDFQKIEFKLECLYGLEKLILNRRADIENIGKTNKKS